MGKARQKCQTLKTYTGSPHLATTIGVGNPDTKC